MARDSAPGSPEEVSGVAPSTVPRMSSDTKRSSIRWGLPITMPPCSIFSEWITRGSSTITTPENNRSQTPPHVGWFRKFLHKLHSQPPRKTPNLNRSESARTSPWRSLLASTALACGLVYTSASHASPTPPAIATFDDSPTVSEPLRGALLIGELSCTACHRSDHDLWDAKRGPDLSLVGSRITPDHLRRFVADPSGTKPGTTMPDLLAHLPASERDTTALALAHFLATLGPRSPVTTAPPSGSGFFG